jgi:hypothetical protein
MIPQLLAVFLLLRGPFSRYFPVFLYLFTYLAVTGAQAWVYYTAGPSNHLYFQVYWGGTLLLDLMMFFLVISLTTRALEGNPMREKMVRLLGGIALLIPVIPFLIFDSTVFGRTWNQSVSQLLNFGAAVMNLALWSALILSRQRDRQLMSVSAGLGIMVACAALTLGVRRFTQQDDSIRVIADYLYRVGQIAGPAIWCKAFWPHRRFTPPAAEPSPSAS